MHDIRAMSQGADLHLDNLLVEVDAAVVHHLHHPLLLAGWADLGLLNVPQDILHQLLVLAAITLKAGMAAITELILAASKKVIRDIVPGCPSPKYNINII